MVSVRVEDKFVERLRTAIEYRCYNPVGGARDAVAEDRIDLMAGTSQQPC
jgi:hypothetical protein